MSARMDEAIFEAPAAHEMGWSGESAGLHEFGGNPETAMEFSWELQEASHYGQPESSLYAMEDEDEDETAFEDEWELPESLGSLEYPETFETFEFPEANLYGNPYAGYEDETLGETYETYETYETSFEDEISAYGNPEWEDEWEDEADLFFKKLGRFAKGIGKGLAKVAKKLAPMAIGALGSMIPGVGVVAGPLMGKLASSLLREAAMEAASMEAAFFSGGQGEWEVGNTESAHEAALTELLAHEATMATNESEAEAILATSLPITITIMRARRTVRPVMPVLAQANGRLIQTLRRQGPAGQQLLRTVPTIQRRTIAILRAAARNGQPITSPLAVRAMAAATGSVLGNPRQVQRAVERNMVLRHRVAPPNPRRAATFTPNRVAPPNPRRAAGYQPMRATAARPPVYRR